MDRNSREELNYFRYCRNIEGRLVPIDLAVQNGRVVPRFERSLFEPAITDDEESNEYVELVEEVSQNLNHIERCTWLRILDGISILDIAAEDKVSRAAIYDRLNRMVRKNDYVAIWWERRKKANRG